MNLLTNFHHPNYIIEHILIIDDIVNISFGAEIFMCERCYQNMTTVQILHAQVL